MQCLITGKQAPAALVHPAIKGVMGAQSAGAALDILKKEYGCRYLTLMDIIAAPEGVKAVTEAHPDVDLYVAAVDDHLNEYAYIVPGLGDAGDRIFGTK